MQGLLLDPDEKPCDTNTAYISVVVQGTAVVQISIEKMTGKYYQSQGEQRK